VTIGVVFTIFSFRRENELMFFSRVFITYCKKYAL
jgi:hypothetical protein